MIFRQGRARHSPLTSQDKRASGANGAAAPDTPTRGSVFRTSLVNVSYVSLWVALSAAVILQNKWILSSYGFPFPITLTMWHMAFVSGLSALLVRGGLVAAEEKMTSALYFRAVVPIGALFAVVLWLGNAAYVYLSVSFIQMLKALMPVAVFATGCAWGVERFSRATLANMLLITAGVAVASYGELDFVAAGVALQLASVAAESSRLILVQILLQKRGLRLNPLTSAYYIAPASLACLLPPWLAFEAGPLLARPRGDLRPAIFLGNAASAFLLNLCVYLVIGRTSALTMNIGGVFKDWLLILLSVVLLKGRVTALNLAGYSLAFVGVCYYNYRKVAAAKPKRQEDAGGAPQGEAVPAGAGAVTLGRAGPEPKHLLGPLQLRSPPQIRTQSV